MREDEFRKLFGGAVKVNMQYVSLSMDRHNIGICTCFGPEPTYITPDQIVDALSFRLGCGDFTVRREK